MLGVRQQDDFVVALFQLFGVDRSNRVEQIVFASPRNGNRLAIQREVVLDRCPRRRPKP